VKIAPVLTALMADLWSNAHGKKPHPKASMEGNRRVIRLATADLRALLSVARAGQRAVDVWRINYEIEPPTPEDKSLDRALRRLSRVSGRGGARERTRRAPPRGEGDAT
jgi:hypothetical protein